MTTRRIPYTYLIGWSQHDLWYYGSETKKTAHPDNLWKRYFTSSKEVKRLRQEIGEPDIIEVRKTFESPQKAYAWEQEVLYRMKTTASSRWLNRAVYGRKLFSDDPARIEAIVSARRQSGKPWHSQETKDAIARAHQGKTLDLTEEERQRRTSELRRRNLEDADFKARNAIGRARRWADPEQVEQQAERMRRSAKDPAAQAGRIAKQRTEAARAASAIKSKETWHRAEEGMRTGFKEFFSDPVRKEAHRQKMLDNLRLKRGWSVIVLEDGHEFDTISACAAHLKKDHKWVRSQIKAGLITTR